MPGVPRYAALAASSQRLCLPLLSEYQPPASAFPLARFLRVFSSVYCSPHALLNALAVSPSIYPTLSTDRGLSEMFTMSADTPPPVTPPTHRTE